jgi:hypothetical protein
MSSKTTKANTLSSLRATHDRRVVIPNKIRTALAAMAKSGDEWKYDEEFRKLAGVSPADLKEFRDDKEFKDLWAEMPATNGRRTCGASGSPPKNWLTPGRQSKWQPNSTT